MALKTLAALNGADFHNHGEHIGLRFRLAPAGALTLAVERENLAEIVEHLISTLGAANQQRAEHRRQNGLPADQAPARAAVVETIEINVMEALRSVSLTLHRSDIADTFALTAQQSRQIGESLIRHAAQLEALGASDH